MNIQRNCVEQRQAITRLINTDVSYCLIKQI